MNTLPLHLTLKNQITLVYMYVCMFIDSNILNTILDMTNGYHDTILLLTCNASVVGDSSGNIVMNV